MKLHASPTLGALLGLLLATDLIPAASAAFANVKEGDAVPEATLPTVDGKKEPLLGKAHVSVFVFFRPGQEHSRVTLEALGQAQKEFAGKPVRWTAVVSDHFPSADVLADVKASGFTGPVLVDAADTLYGTLGVAMQPCIGIADKDHKLLFYQAFTKINYADVILARVRFALGEIDQAAMNKVIDPPAATQGGEAQVLRRYFKLGERLYKAKDFPKALDSARKCLEHDAANGACNGLMAAALAAQGSCAEAKLALEKALAADPKDPLAAESKAACP